MRSCKWSLNHFSQVFEWDTFSLFRKLKTAAFGRLGGVSLRMCRLGAIRPMLSLRMCRLGAIRSMLSLTVHVQTWGDPVDVVTAHVQTWGDPVDVVTAHDIGVQAS
ncbi:hypothetical protein DPMN_048843 [Dreissena polymorpha]|uniref:Uncharacterized protein n=1 Tax=Dreissena polymorpha TaxID=45954 RepID=A0A9D4DAQ9_DREPO|nr:hypothetical protein DPMN_048843 [Dreissena polymorpha]